MTEADWLRSTDPAAMLDLITGKSEGPHAGGIATDRKLRLLACAFRRQLRWLDNKWKDSGWDKLEQDGEPIDKDSWTALQYAKLFLKDVAPDLTPELKSTIIRLIFGNPFRRVELPHSICEMCGTKTCRDRHDALCDGCNARWPLPEWVWSGNVFNLAQACYDLRDPGYFPLIWDALEEAGCREEEIRRALMWQQRCPKCLGSGKDWVQYGHGRSYAAKCFGCGEVGPSEFGTGWLPIPGEPFCPRGHWVIDLLLGKE